MENYEKVLYKLAVILFVLPVNLCSVPPGVNSDILSQTTSLGDCQACKVFVESFVNGLERTARGNYEGGDTAWEEEKLKKSYRRSEMRLVDIQDGLCKEVSKHSIQCHQYAEKAEESIEKWWALDSEDPDPLYPYICIDSLKVCCPPNHYGKDCSPCPGDHENPCSGNGKCRGDGTRKGNGTCICNEGFTGVNCDFCDIGFYMLRDDANKMRCLRCDISCLGGCTGLKPTDCEVCNFGFVLDGDEGCRDINECEDRKICKTNQFCINTLGSYRCIECDKSCETCYAEGPDSCTKCSKEYSKQGELCLPTGYYDVDDMFSNTR